MHYISFRTVSSSVFLVLSTDDALQSGTKFRGIVYNGSVDPQRNLGRPPLQV